MFSTLLDLKGHVVEEHGGEMTSRDKRDARRIAAEFEFEEVAGRGRRGGHREREREREPPPPSHHPPPGTSSASAPARPGGRRTREGFGANLTADNPPDAPPGTRTPEIVNTRTPSPHADVDPAVAE